MGGPMDSDTPPSSPLPQRQQSLSPAPSSRDGGEGWTNGQSQLTKFVQAQTFQSVHNTENIYSKIGGGRTQSLDRAGVQERNGQPIQNQTPELRNLTPELRSQTPERIIPIQTVEGRVRTQSLGRGEGLMKDGFGTRETIQIQTRDRSAYSTSNSG